MIDETPSPEFSKEVGRRLRAVRRDLGFSLEDVEVRSKGRWSASAIGAYERGYRNLSLPRLGELAAFYSVPVSRLLADESERSLTPPSPIVIDLTEPACVDLTALEHVEAEDAEHVRRYIRSIIGERRGPKPQRLTLRRSDLSLLASVLGVSVPQLHSLLGEWDALIPMEEMEQLESVV